MEEQIREYYKQVRGAFPHADYIQVAMFCTDSGLSWFVKVDNGRARQCQCRKSAIPDRYKAISAPTFDAALAEVIAQAGA